MKKAALLLAALALLLTAPSGTVLAEEITTLNGEFKWSQRNSSGDLKADFTPTGEDTWDVSFHFKFRGEPHVYSGTAEGSLSEGELSGTVKNETTAQAGRGTLRPHWKLRRHLDRADDRRHAGHGL